ncbi:hypothetical protein KAU39_02730 [bacterium]|nr:hypothetical protein [bacterium]
MKKRCLSLKSSFISIFGLVFVILYLVVGCNNAAKEQEFILKDEEIILNRGDKEIVFSIRQHVLETYRVLEAKIEKDRRLKDDGVVVSLWGIPLHKIPDNRAFSRSDVNQGKLFLLIPSNEYIKNEAIRIAKEKRCWKKVKLTGELVVKIRENGKSFQSNLSYLYLREIDSM